MSMLSFASVSMTIGNKLLMTDTLLAQNSSTVIVLQNVLSVPHGMPHACRCGKYTPYDTATATLLFVGRFCPGAADVDLL